MKIDGPITNNYKATCQVFDAAGKIAWAGDGGDDAVEG
jgi:hypothetical protein